jgi:hypothetical protein
MKKKITKKEVEEKLLKEVGVLHEKVRGELKKQRNEKRRIEQEELRGASEERQEWVKVEKNSSFVFPDRDIYPHGFDGLGEAISMTDPDCHCEPVSVLYHRSFLTGLLPYEKCSVCGTLGCEMCNEDF